MEVIHVSEMNCEEVARRIVELLKGRVFSIATFYYNIDRKHETPKVIENLRLSSDEVVLTSGVMCLKLSPRRTLFWSLNESVLVTFLDSGSFVIQRTIDEKKVIIRTVVNHD